MKVKLSLDPAKVLRFISETRGKFFHVVYLKKDGTERQMTARINVSKGVTGKGLAFNPIERNLLPVWDVTKKNFRMINLDKIIEITIAGDTIVNKDKIS